MKIILLGILMFAGLAEAAMHYAPPQPVSALPCFEGSRPLAGRVIAYDGTCASNWRWLQ